MKRFVIPGGVRLFVSLMVRRFVIPVGVFGLLMVFAVDNANAVIKLPPPPPVELIPWDEALGNPPRGADKPLEADGVEVSMGRPIILPSPPAPSLPSPPGKIPETLEDVGLRKSDKCLPNGTCILEPIPGSKWEVCGR